MKVINLLHYKLLKLKKLHGYVSMSMLNELEKKQLGKPIYITNIYFNEKINNE